MSDSNLRILIVDDERPIRRFLRFSLGNQHTVFEASIGEEALQSVAVERPDLVILDLGLPDIDGADVTRRLREWTQIPIIVVSVREREDDKIAALDAVDLMRFFQTLSNDRLHRDEASIFLVYPSKRRAHIDFIDQSLPNPLQETIHIILQNIST